MFSLLSPYGYKGRYLQRYDVSDDSHKDSQNTMSCRHVWWNAVKSVIGGVSTGVVVNVSDTQSGDLGSILRQGIATSTPAFHRSNL